MQRIGLVLIILLTLTAAAGIYAGARYYSTLTSDLPSVELLPILMDSQKGQLLQPTRFYDRTGTKIIYTLENSGIERKFLSLDPALPDSFSPWLTQAVIGYYQPGYWKDNPTSLFQADKNIDLTIAERLVNDLLLWKEADGSRKSFQTRVLASQTIQQYGRTKVLEWFINSLDFGHNAWGAEEAAQLYLGKSAHDLDLAEAATLIGIAQVPALNPIDVPAKSDKFNAPVLEHLLLTKAITSDQYRQASQENVVIVPNQQTPANSALAIVTTILSQLQDTFPQKRLERGGLNVVTTLDLNLQQQVDCAVQLQLARLKFKSFDATLPDGSTCAASSTLQTYIGLLNPLSDNLSASALMLDPQTGEILAMVGDSRSGSSGKTMLAHEPGSLLTPFAAVAGFARGMSPATLVWDTPSRLPNAVKNYYLDGTKYLGPMRLRQAIAGDVLNPTAQLLDQLGAGDVWRSIEPFGITGLAAAANPSELIYEGGSLSPIRLAQAYAIFANQGMAAGWDSKGDGMFSPVTVLAVTDPDGNLVWQGMKTELKTVLSAPLAYLVHDVLAGTVSLQAGAASRNLLDIGVPSAAKTGKTVDGSNAWTIGYTPQRIGVIWLGEAAGGMDTVDPQMAAGIWNAVMRQAQIGLPVQDWTPPADVVKVHVCDPSGLLPTTLCPTVVEEYFLSGEEPLAYDNLYQAFQVDRDTGMLATVFTPLDRVDSKVFEVVPDDAHDWAVTAGLPIPPKDYDTILMTPANPDVKITSPQNFVTIHGQLKIQGSAEGTAFNSYRVEAGQGINPQSWMLISKNGSNQVKDGILADWDTTGLDGLYAIRLVMVHSDQTFDTAVVQVTVDNTPPVISMQNPQNGQVISKSDHILFNADVSDNLGIARVEWWLDGSLVGESDSTPFALNWQTRQGIHTLFARAFDWAGNMAQSESIQFEVKP